MRYKRKFNGKRKFKKRFPRKRGYKAKRIKSYGSSRGGIRL